MLGQLEALGAIGVSGVYWVSGRKCRYLGDRRGIGGIRGHWGTPRGCWGCWRHWESLGVSGVYWVSGRKCRYSGARRV